MSYLVFTEPWRDLKLSTACTKLLWSRGMNQSRYFSYRQALMEYQIRLPRIVWWRVKVRKLITRREGWKLGSLAGAAAGYFIVHSQCGWARAPRVLELGEEIGRVR